MDGFHTIMVILLGTTIFVLIRRLVDYYFPYKSRTWRGCNAFAIYFLVFFGVAILADLLK